MDLKELKEGELCWAVVPAGGSGQRFVEAAFNQETDKLMALLEGLPVLVRTVASLLARDRISAVVISARPQCIESYKKALEAYGFEKPIHWVDGGETRRDSVYKAICAIPDFVKLVAIHDAARPLVNPNQVDEAIEAVCSGALGAFLALPIQDTLKSIDPESGGIKTVDRQHFVRAQTPQVFERSTILKAHEAVSKVMAVTDDIQLLELFETEGRARIQWIKGSENNLKITTQDDMRRASQIIRENLNNV